MNTIRTLLLAVFLVAIHTDIYACWDDEDDAYIYGDYDDDCIWLDEVYIDDEDWPDDDFDSDWWRNDDEEETYDDDDDDSYDDIYDDEYIGQSDGQDSSLWTKMEKYHTPAVDERLPLSSSRQGEHPRHGQRERNHTAAGVMLFEI